MGLPCSPVYYAVEGEDIPTETLWLPFIIKPEAEVVNVLDTRDGCPSRLPDKWW